MSARTKWYNTQRKLLNKETRKEIEDLVLTKDRYVSNIEKDLRDMNEHELANEMLHQLESQLRTSPVRVSMYTKKLLNDLKEKKEDGSLESYDEVIQNILN